MTAIAIFSQTCRCGLVMRTSATRDAWECRCGMTLDAQPVYAAHHAGGSIPDDAWRQGEPWKEPAPGIRVSNDFADIGPLCWEVAHIDPSAIDRASLERACADAYECSGLRYAGIARPTGRCLITEEGDELHRRRVYALAPLGQEAAAIRAVVQAIRGMYGPGRVWAHGDTPVAPMVHHTEGYYRGGSIGGVMHVLLASYYFHQPDVPR